MYNKKQFSFEKKVQVFVAVFLIILFSGVIILCNSGNIEFLITQDELIITSTYLHGYSLSLDNIKKIEYTEKDHKGSRTSGFGSVRLSLGAFKNEIYNEYTRYSYTKCTSGIIITEKDGDILVISKSSPAETLKLYKLLSEKISLSDSKGKS